MSVRYIHHTELLHIQQVHLQNTNCTKYLNFCTWAQNSPISCYLHVALCALIWCILFSAFICHLASVNWHVTSTSWLTKSKEVLVRDLDIGSIFSLKETFEKFRRLPDPKKSVSFGQVTFYLFLRMFYISLCLLKRTYQPKLMILGIASVDNSGYKILNLQLQEIKFQRNNDSCSKIYYIQTFLYFLSMKAAANGFHMEFPKFSSDHFMQIMLYTLQFGYDKQHITLHVNISK